MGTPDFYHLVNNFTRFEAIKSNKLLGESTVNLPFFTIVIPTYKRGNLITVSVKSALDQKGFDDYEIVIVDNNPDMSDYQTRNALVPLLTSRIRYFVNEENIGPCGNWNRCIELAKGKYVVMLHDDDLLAPTFLRTVHQVILGEQEPGIVGVGYSIFSGTDYPVFEDPNLPKIEPITKYGFFFNKSINITGMTFKRELAIALGGFTPEYMPNIDTCFILQGIINSRVLNVKHSLAGYRIENNDSLSGNTMRDIILMIEKMREGIAAHEKFAHRFMSLFDSEYLYLYVMGANNYWKLNIDYRDIFAKAEMKRNDISQYRLRLLKLFLKMNRYIIKFLELRNKM